MGRSGLAGAGSAGPARGRSILFARTALAVLTALSLAACSGAEAASKTTKVATTRKKAVKKTTRKPVTTTKATSTTVRPAATTTVVPKLSLDAKAVLSGYEAYLQAFVDASRTPESAATILPKAVTGDALARLLEIAKFNVTEGYYWDGTRTNVLSKGRVETVGETRATLRDCRIVGGLLRKRANNEVVTGSTDPDIDDLLVDLVKIDGRWFVTRTDRTNQIEGRSTCAANAPPS